MFPLLLVIVVRHQPSKRSLFKVPDEFSFTAISSSTDFYWFTGNYVLISKGREFHGISPFACFTDIDLHQCLFGFPFVFSPLVHPTNYDSFSACPSVSPSREVSGHFLENAWKGWSAIWHTDVPWPSSELIGLWSRSIDFPPFWHHFDLMKWVKFGFPGFSGKTYGGGLKVCMLMYPGCFQNWLVYGHGLRIVSVLVPLWLVNLVNSRWRQNEDDPQTVTIN